MDRLVREDYAVDDNSSYEEFVHGLIERPDYFPELLFIDENYCGRFSDDSPEEPERFSWHFLHECGVAISFFRSKFPQIGTQDKYLEMEVSLLGLGTHIKKTKQYLEERVGRLTLNN
ncbi:hypothetical protein CMI42_00475 [Candidatus Pacearchaeota archaeon]|nr:hypothetical protein [Candidatus Pacearchaeota archaeon]|tara:strand:- start:767 stop:1117 length:351 start_codon:yes stop_codon:yes gene_type:complete